jgi:hypothetical protein
MLFVTSFESNGVSKSDTAAATPVNTPSMKRNLKNADFISIAAISRTLMLNIPEIFTAN